MTLSSFDIASILGSNNSSPQSAISTALHSIKSIDMMDLLLLITSNHVVIAWSKFQHSILPILHHRGASMVSMCSSNQLSIIVLKIIPLSGTS
jgi:hypothetical protein